MKFLAQRLMQNRQRIVPLDQKCLRNAVFYFLDSRAELHHVAGTLQTLQQLRRRFALLRYPPDLINDAILVILNDPAVVCERTDSESLALCPSALHQEITILLNKTLQACGNLRAERRIFSDFYRTSPI